MRIRLNRLLTALLLAPLAALCADDSKPAGVRLNNFELPVVLANPGAKFQDDARPGAMIIGMDRTPKGRIWGCWTGTGDKADGYFLLATSDDDARDVVEAATGGRRAHRGGAEDQRHAGGQSVDRSAGPLVALL